MKRLMTIQDISCVGKCSLTVASPIISAMGIETAVLPTAVLSTHTMFSEFTYRDLTEDMAPITAHLKKEKMTFDAIYTGYLGSFEQIELVEKFIDTFQQGETLVFIDPVMADNGQLYPGFSSDFPKRMAQLCAKADVIVPNMTEACLMLGIPYVGTQYTRESLQDMLRQLSALGPKKAMITGVSFEEGKLGAMQYDREADSFEEYYQEHLPVSFHGTGDIFSSALVGALLRGKQGAVAIQIAADFTVESIRATMRDENPRWYGVNFEEAIPGLIRSLGL